ncbi:VWA domain-containing protein [Roseovarius sp.]|uniref:VWA domain-containing protein n=1 Tax=Roseovarius sp. TaxID=1486281 RepID=UPI003B5C407F
MSRFRRLAPPLAACAFAALAAADPGMPVERDLRDALVVVDVTRSMNVRDMGGRARLDAVRIDLRNWIADQPCGTRIGLALFTERRSLTLFTPIDVCTDFASLSEALEMLDWRMAWEGDSRVAKGLNHALDRAAALDVPLIFVTDGHEAPPLPYSGPDPYRGDSPGGVIVGVGGATPAPIPKFDNVGREIGFYEAQDVNHAPARLGAPPKDASTRPGYHPRNNPYGESDLDGNEHLSALRASYLESLAAAREMAFVRLDQGGTALDEALKAVAPGRSIEVQSGLGPLFGALSLAALLSGWMQRSSARTQKRTHSQSGKRSIP